ncbi:MAG: NAD(P)H-hydrate dehydratase [Clostridia bacterium]|nr:NAD(P)H-hydrate dehydratase [Clostridia bacterium]
MQNVISVENMRKSDKYTIDNITPSLVLMERAGKAVFSSVKWSGKAAIICGTGNNGGDGYVLALEMAKNNLDCEIILVKDKFSPDGKYYFSKCKELNIPYIIYNESIDLNKYDFIVDCIFGTGFKGDVNGIEKEIIEKINSSNAYTVSVDINSGLNGDNGLTSLCVISDLTVSIGTLKAGHILNMAKDKIGKLINKDIGITVIDKSYSLLENDDIKSIIKIRKSYSHKGTYGYVSLIGGSIEYSGAIKLANISSSAVRSGAGVVRLCVPNSITNGVLPYILESTLYPLSDKNGSIAFNQEELDILINSSKVIAIGMGLGTKGENEKILTYLINNYKGILIIDADGLNTLAKMDLDLKNLSCKIVLTPHPKEFERLSKIPMSQVNENPIKYSMDYAKNNNVILLLKGTATIVTDGENTYLINTGCPGMATGGSGDVLSGILSGICASNDASLIENVAAGAYINGIAGEIAKDKSNDISMSAYDTASSVKEAITKIIK